VKKIIFEKNFAESISYDSKQNSSIDNENLEAIAIPSDYAGPILNEEDEITTQWVQKLMDYFKDQKKLTKKILYVILKKVKKIFKEHENLESYNYPDDIELTVCGDVHGQYYDLINIFKINGFPSENNPYLFNGDFVDRGSFSVEVIVSLFAWKCCFPKYFHLTRGNHEGKNMNKMYGFEGEVIAKYDSNTMEIFSDIFCTLPLGYVLNKKVMVCHGGLFSQDGVKLEDINKISRFNEIPDTGIMADMLWSDPVP